MCDFDASLYSQNQYQSLLPFAAASVPTAPPATSNLPSASSSSFGSIHSSASARELSSPLACPGYQQKHDISNQLSGVDDISPVNYHLSPDSLFPLSTEGSVSHAQNAAAATIAPTSPWLDLLELNHNNLDRGDQSLSSSFLLSSGINLQAKAASTLSNPPSDSPVPDALSECNLLYPDSKGNALDIDESLFSTLQGGLTIIFPLVELAVYLFPH